MRNNGVPTTAGGGGVGTTVNLAQSAGTGQENDGEAGRRIARYENSDRFPILIG